MKKKVAIWSLIRIFTIYIGFMIINILKTKENTAELNVDETTQNLVKVSKENVMDDCINEWEDYNDYIEEKIEEASNNLIKDDTHYMIKDESGYIVVYYLDDNNEEFLYKKTNISTEYLSPEDLDDLEIGIEVVGIEALNKVLEDFE